MRCQGGRPSAISTPEMFVFVRDPAILLRLLEDIGLNWQICCVFQVCADSTSNTRLCQLTHLRPADGAFLQQFEPDSAIIIASIDFVVSKRIDIRERKV